MAMHDLTVTYDEGEPVHVGAGQREMAEFEAQSFGCSSLTALDVKPAADDFERCPPPAPKSSLDL